MDKKKFNKEFPNFEDFSIKVDLKEFNDIIETPFELQRANEIGAVFVNAAQIVIEKQIMKHCLDKQKVKKAIEDIINHGNEREMIIRKALFAELKLND